MSNSVNMTWFTIQELDPGTRPFRLIGKKGQTILVDSAEPGREMYLVREGESREFTLMSGSDRRWRPYPGAGGWYRDGDDLAG